MRLANRCLRMRLFAPHLSVLSLCIIRSWKPTTMGDVCGNWCEVLNRPVHEWHRGVARLSTFTDFHNDRRLDLRIYADAGFRCCDDDGKGKIIKCCFCPVELDPIELTPNDEPHMLHRLLYSSCPFVQCKITENTPIIKNPFIEMKYNLSRYLPHWTE